MIPARCFYLDDESSWPIKLRELLDNHFESLKQYEIERRRVNRLSDEGDLWIRTHRPANPYQAVHDDMIADCGVITESLEVIGYHCTRLHEAEIASVKAEGIQALSGDFLTTRIRLREAAGDFTPSVASRLLATHDAEEEYRRGQIWFVFNRRLLGEEGGVCRFFKYWGGEALYRRHSLDAVTSPWIERIGVPCILEVGIPVASISSLFTNIPARIISVYLLHREVEPELKDDAEGYVNQDIAAERVRRVIRLTDPEFMTLTRCDKWDECPSTTP